MLFALSPSAGLRADDDRLIATVGEQPIKLSDLYAKIEALPLGDQLQYRENLERFAESVVREEILFQYALKTLLREDNALRERIKAELVEALVAKEVRDKVALSVEDVRAYYDANPEAMRSEHWRVSHIPLASRADCDALLPTLTDEAAMLNAAKTAGTVPALAAKGGDMGYFMRHHNVLGLGELLFSLPLKEPFMFENEDGCHIVWISEHLRPEIPSFEQVRPRLEAFLRAQAEADLLGELVRAANASVPVTRAE